MNTAPNDTASVLRSMYAAESEYLAAGGPGIASFATLAPYFAPDVVLHQADALPYGGIWRGHDGMEQFFVAMSQTWSEFDMVEQEFLSTTGTAVVLDPSPRAGPRHGSRIGLPDPSDHSRRGRTHHRRAPVLLGHRGNQRRVRLNDRRDVRSPTGSAVSSVSAIS